MEPGQLTGIMSGPDFRLLLAGLADKKKREINNLS